MPTYSDQKYYSRVFVPAGFAVDFGTATATVDASTDVAATLPKFKRRTQINAVRLRCTTIPNANSTVLLANFVNGTNTFGTAVITTAAADGFVDGVITSAANAIFAADGQPKVNMAGTHTASGVDQGDFDIWFEVQELFA